MAVYNVKCYFNTGLSAGNSMESLLALENAGFKSLSLEGVWVLQNRGLGKIKLAVTYDAIKDVDYCVIGDTAYWVTGLGMLNENVCELVLQTDFITSIGIANIEVVDGWATRRHVMNDEPFSNTLAEPFTPAKPLKLDFGGVIKPTTAADTDYRIVVSTVDLESAEYVARTYHDNLNDLSVTVPQVPIAMRETKFRMGGYSYRLPKAGCYNYDLVNDGIRSVRSLGIESCIVASYTIPARYVGVGSSEDVRHEMIAGIDEVINSQFDPEFSGVKNKKALSGQFTRYVLMSLVTGEKIVYPVEEILSDGVVRWRIMADPLPDGFPIVIPKTFHGAENSAFFGAVKGGNWQQNPIQYTQKSGGLLEAVEYGRSFYGKADTVASSRGMNISNFAAPLGWLGNLTTFLGDAASMDFMTAEGMATTGMGKFVLGGMSSLTGGPTAVAGGLIKSAGQLLGNKKLEFETSQNIIAPEIPYRPVNSLQNYYGNYFQEFRYRLDDSDLDNFDRFLSAYGYAVSEPLTKDCFTGRRNFNYVKANNVLLKTPRSKADTQSAAEQIETGVRIWHTIPSQEKLFDNPIKGV